MNHYICSYIMLLKIHPKSMMGQKKKNNHSADLVKSSEQFNRIGFCIFCVFYWAWIQLNETKKKILVPRICTLVTHVLLNQSFFFFKKIIQLWTVYFRVESIQFEPTTFEVTSAFFFGPNLNNLYNLTEKNHGHSL